MDEQPIKKKRSWLWLLLPAGLLLGTALYFFDVPHVSVDKGEGHFSVTIGNEPEEPACSSAESPQEEAEAPASMQDILENVAPSVVTVLAGDAQETGVILSEDGYIITGQIAAEGGLTVCLSDERSFSAELVLDDPERKLTVLKIDAEDLTPARFDGAEQLQKGSDLGALGITVRDLPDRAQRFFRLPPGAHVVSVQEGSDALGHLFPGDIITALNETVVRQPDDLLCALEGKRAGETVSVTLFRRGEYRTLDILLMEKPGQQ